MHNRVNESQLQTVAVLVIQKAKENIFISTVIKQTVQTEVRQKKRYNYLTLFVVKNNISPMSYVRYSSYAKNEEKSHWLEIKTH